MDQSEGWTTVTYKKPKKYIKNTKKVVPEEKEVEKNVVAPKYTWADDDEDMNFFPPPSHYKSKTTTLE